MVAWSRFLGCSVMNIQRIVHDMEALRNKPYNWNCRRPLSGSHCVFLAVPPTNNVFSFIAVRFLIARCGSFLCVWVQGSGTDDFTMVYAHRQNRSFTITKQTVSDSEFQGECIARWVCNSCLCQHLNSPLCVEWMELNWLLNRLRHEHATQEG